MFLKRFYHEGLAQASYMIGCQATGEAVVVDALRSPELYLEAAEANDLRITLVTETHIHADYLSGSRELALAAHAKLLVPGGGGAGWEYAFTTPFGFERLKDGDVVNVGHVALRVMHVPGHTPEHIVFSVVDAPSSPEPMGVLTGDFLFVGDVGRPDLLERAAHQSGTMELSARALYDSLARFAAAFPDYVQIWPGHGSGSACGKALGAVPSSSLGYERLSNWALRPQTRDAFVQEVLRGQPEPPPYFATMKRLNRDGPPLLSDRPPLVAIEPARLAELAPQLVDLRTTAAFARAHAKGSLNLPFNNAFLQRAGWLLGPDRPFALISTDETPATAVAARDELGLIGLDRCMGWFGPQAFSQLAGVATASIAQISPTEANAKARRREVLVIDVRNADEWQGGHVPDAVHIPLGHLAERAAELDPSRPIVLHCQGGGRSSIGASVLKARGFFDVSNMVGGFAAWSKANLPVVHG